MTQKFICPPEFIALAQQMAETARPIARHYFRNDELVTENKSDRSLVTLADREIEEKWREIVLKHRPQDAIWGEEYGRENQDAEWTWLFDPIDGTNSFTLGRPIFGCMIGLYHRQHDFVLGLVDQPILDMRWTGIKNGGATLNGKTLRNKAIAMKDVRISISNPLRMTPALRQLHDELKKEVALLTHGGNCWNYLGIADGSMHAYFDPTQKLYDIAPVLPIIREAGGVVSTMEGNEIAFCDDQSFLCASCPDIHADILARYQRIISMEQAA